MEEGNAGAKALATDSQHAGLRARRALRARWLTDAYCARPACQRNDYIGWIVNAKRDETRHKPLAQMLDELEMGGVYMNMSTRPAQSDHALDHRQARMGM